MSDGFSLSGFAIAAMAAVSLISLGSLDQRLAAQQQGVEVWRLNDKYYTFTITKERVSFLGVDCNFGQIETAEGYTIDKSFLKDGMITVTDPEGNVTKYTDWERFGYEDVANLYKEEVEQLASIAMKDVTYEIDDDTKDEIRSKVMDELNGVELVETIDEGEMEFSDDIGELT